MERYALAYKFLAVAFIACLSLQGCEDEADHLKALSGDGSATTGNTSASPTTTTMRGSGARSATTSILPAEATLTTTTMLATSTVPDEATTSIASIIAATTTSNSVAKSCAAFGKGGIRYWNSCTDLLVKHQVGMSVSLPQSVSSEIAPGDKYGPALSWACKVGQGRIAITVGERNKVLLWTPSDNTFEEIQTGSVNNLVGCTYSHGKLWVVGFGKWIGDCKKGEADCKVKSGLASIDLDTKTVVEHMYDDELVHLHNVYSFDWGGQKHIFVAVMGNPWATSIGLGSTGSHPEVGKGLVRFDVAAAKFVTIGVTLLDLNARSAVQQSASVFYILTQDNQKKTELARVEKDGSSFRLITKVEMPTRAGGDGDGGADVFLSQEADTVFATDRTDNGGQLYAWKYQAAAPVTFEKRSEHGTGNHPRHAVALSTGDVVTVDSYSDQLSIFSGLAQSPSSSVTATKVPTMKYAKFFMEDVGIVS